CNLLFLVLRHHPTSTLFPYTTLFRSDQPRAREDVPEQVRVDLAPVLEQVVEPRADQAADHDAERHLPGPVARPAQLAQPPPDDPDRKSTRLNSSHVSISYAVFCLKKK